jgi:hypothetical protein
MRGTKENQIVFVRIVLRFEAEYASFAFAFIRRFDITHAPGRP